MGKHPGQSSIAPTALLAVKVVPSASRNRVVGRLGDAVKVQTQQAAEAGKANGAVAKLLADWLGVPERDVALVQGPTRARKVFAVRGINPQQLRAKVARLDT